MIQEGDLRVFWDGHASLRFEDRGFVVAVDPFGGVSPEFTADIVLVTHGDEGHYDPEKLEDVCGDRTCVVFPDSMKDVDSPSPDTEPVEEGEIIDIYGVEIEAIPAYNEHHDRGEGLGYRLNMDGTNLYVAGDTGVIDEARELDQMVDIAFLPVEGVFTMGIEEAVSMATKFRPSKVVPYHYGKPFFEDRNLKPLESALEDRSIECEIVEPED